MDWHSGEMNAVYLVKHLRVLQPELHRRVLRGELSLVAALIAAQQVAAPPSDSVKSRGLIARWRAAGDVERAQLLRFLAQPNSWLEGRRTV